MAHQSIRVNLASVIFPFTKELWGRSIIQPGFDQNYERALVSSADIGKDKGVPMACYLHNCMPTTEGYQSIGYHTETIGVAGETNFDKVFSILQTSPNNAHFLFSPALGRNYVYDGTLGGWASISPFAPGVIGAKTTVTTAYIQGQTYIYFAKIGCFIYDQVNKVFTPVALNGLDPTTIIGITASFGYLVAFNETQVVWSSATNPTDFVPSLITGAGGGPVNDIKGNITIGVSLSGGFLLFCEKNVVSARYSGNIRFPFVFKEIPNSGGISSQDQICYGSNAAEIYCYTTSGIQKFSLTACENDFPEVTDFLAKRIYENFDDVTLTWTEQRTSSILAVKVALIGSRFLVISYGLTIGNYTYALIHDLTLKRWGKVKIPHVSCFQWNAPNIFGAVTYGELGVVGLTYGDLANVTYGDLNTSINSPELPLQTIAFVSPNGTIKTVNFDLDDPDNSLGTLLLGKYQFSRNKRINHQFTEIETVDRNAPFVMYLFTSKNGKDFDPAILATEVVVGEKMRRWAKWAEGRNYSVLFQGSFNLTTVVTDFTQGGDW